ncbi:Cholestenol Delta-isomerase [Purpureocillium takamizusanense]|uniref:Cholestenol Delta-isomerase n=1 Tax=Purpureocillium takamizusanense TaxID=2060973 RepID=A0A9Q8VA93_9HYPO|nr:Cholestenol Delta-isomerase [Purpureocillium takamizusanense]UNI17567.1 Cholestenol Delta-isomerase [Purpureocillium takamizusanense]
MDAPAMASHPFYPLGAPVKNYVANTIGPVTLVAIFAAACGALFVPTALVAARVRPGLPLTELLIAFWFVLCGCIHLFFEGYFAYNFLDMASRTDLFGQLWKEYSLSDSRYMTQDPFVVCMETVTAVFWGPLSFFCAYAVLTRSPLRHPVQLVVSLGQLYGDVLYYCICWFNELLNGLAYSRPERFYYWAYFVLCNAFWIVIPLLLMAQSVRESAAAFARGHGLANGAVKKAQ